ncbi:MAG TPA: adenosine kinase [Caulobacteraceae bacterium]|jgi:sugar/nucleoside kinase (ribokinase family)
MTEALDLVAIGNAIVDVIAPAQDAFLDAQALRKGAMTLIDDERAARLYDAMAPGVETSGGSAANTVAGVASLGGKAAFVGKVADDLLGEVFAHDIEAIGATFETPKLEGAATGRCLINVTPDAHRTMATFLGAANRLTPSDVNEAQIGQAFAVYLEGYLFDPPPAREAFVKAAGAARAADRKVAMTLSDVFVVERWRDELLAFLDHTDIVFANEVELKSLYQTEDFDAALAQLSARVEITAVTRSEHGSIVRRGDERYVIPAFPIEKVLDTTGAGDQYAAGFLFGLARGKPLDACGAMGALCAWEVIGHYGPRPQTSLEKLAKERGLL